MGLVRIEPDPASVRQQNLAARVSKRPADGIERLAQGRMCSSVPPVAPEEGRCALPTGSVIAPQREPCKQRLLLSVGELNAPRVAQPRLEASEQGEQRPSRSCRGLKMPRSLRSARSSPDSGRGLSWLGQRDSLSGPEATLAPCWALERRSSMPLVPGPCASLPAPRSGSRRCRSWSSRPALTVRTGSWAVLGAVCDARGWPGLALTAVR